MVSNSAQYQCKFGSDLDNPDEQFVEELVESNVATNCGDFCLCEGFTNNTCLFGPDAIGNFLIDREATSEEVDSCNWCICDKHADVIAQMTENDLTFEEVA